MKALRKDRFQQEYETLSVGNHMIFVCRCLS